MPEIGRFAQVDPLAETYVYNSPYAFAENKVIAYGELEGLEAYFAPGSGGNNLFPNAKPWGKLSKEEKKKELKAAGQALKNAARDVADEIPFVGEFLSLMEGDYQGAMMGFIPFGKKGKKVVEALDEANDASKKSKRRFSKKDRDQGFEDSKDADGTPRCEYCDAELDKNAGSPNSYEADHRKSYKNGGKSEKDNLAPSCRTCNRKKGSKDAEEFIEERKKGQQSGTSSSSGSD